MEVVEAWEEEKRSSEGKEDGKEAGARMDSVSSSDGDLESDYDKISELVVT